MRAIQIKYYELFGKITSYIISDTGSWISDGVGDATVNRDQSDICFNDLDGDNSGAKHVFVRDLFIQTNKQYRYIINRTGSRSILT